MKTKSPCKHASAPDHSADVQIKLEDLNDDFVKSSMLHRPSCSIPKTAAATSSNSSGIRRSNRINKVYKLKHVFIPLSKIKKRIQQAQEQEQEQAQEQPTQAKEEKAINTAPLASSSSSSSSSSSQIILDINIIQARKYHSTNEDIKKLISYIVDDRMDIPAAAERVNMAVSTANMYYDKYLKDPQHKIPTSRRSRHPKVAFFFNNYNYIKGLYDSDPKMGLPKLERLLTAAFPDLYVTTILLHYIHSKMRSSRRQVVTFSKCEASNEDNKSDTKRVHNSITNSMDDKRDIMKRRILVKNKGKKNKFTEEHIAFLKNLMETQPGLPFFKLRNRLVERFSGFRTSPTELGRQIRIHLPDVYQRTRNSIQQANDLRTQWKAEQEQLREELHHQIKTQGSSNTILKEQQPDLSKSEIKKRYLNNSSTTINSSSNNNNNNDDDSDDDDDGLYIPDKKYNQKKSKGKMTLKDQKRKENLKHLFNVEQRQCLIGILRAYPSLPVYKLRWQLLKRFPELKVVYRSFAEYLRIELRRSPAFSERAGCGELEKAQRIFIENQVFMEPVMDLPAIFCKLVRAFPDYDGSYHKFSSFIQTRYPVRYQNRKSYKRQGINTVLKPEHIEFLRNLFKNDDPDTPTVSLNSAHLGLLKAFPNENISFSTVQTCVFKLKL